MIKIQSLYCIFVNFGVQLSHWVWKFLER